MKKVIFNQNSKIKKQQGVAIIEFALIALLVFALSFGIITFGVALYNYAVITNASREGARAAVVVPVAARGYSASTTTCSTTTLATTGYYSVNISNTADSEYTGRCVALAYMGNNLINLSGSSVAALSQISATSQDAAKSPPTTCTVPVPSCSIKMTITFPYNGVWFLNSINLTAQTTMYYE